MKILWTLTNPWKNHRWKEMFIDLSMHSEVTHVYVVERSYDILTYPIRGIKKVLPPPIPLLQPIHPKLTVIRFPLLYPEKLSANDYSMKLLTNWLKPLFSYTRPSVSVIPSPYQIPIAMGSKLAGSKTIYFVYDEITYTEEGLPNQTAMLFEKKLMQFIDTIVVTTHILKIPREKYQKPIYVRPNGTNTELWRSLHEEPAFLKGIPKPRIVFHGHVGPWIDHEMFIELAQALPHVNFIIIGKLSGEALKLKNTNLPNLHFIKFKPKEEVAAAVQHCDIALMPFKTNNKFSVAINPLKLYEALAAGVPTIISNLPSVPKGPGVFIYKTKDDVYKYIEQILKNPISKEEITKFGQQWDWSKINRQMIRIMGGTINEKV